MSCDDKHTHPPSSEVSERLELYLHNTARFPNRLWCLCFALECFEYPEEIYRVISAKETLHIYSFIKII
jgi:hypothetical protein